MHPKVHDSCFIAPNSAIIGDVEIDAESSVWYSAAIRGEAAPVRIGKRTSIQDCCVVHVDDGYPTTIGDGVTVGHCALVHGAIVGDDCIVGMNASILNGAKVGSGCIIGANALVTGNKEIPDNSLVLGSPGKVVKTDETMVEDIRKNAEIYVKKAKQYLNGEYPAYQHKPTPRPL